MHYAEERTQANTHTLNCPSSRDKHQHTEWTLCVLCVVECRHLVACLVIRFVNKHAMQFKIKTHTKNHNKRKRAQITSKHLFCRHKSCVYQRARVSVDVSPSAIWLLLIESRIVEKTKKNNLRCSFNDINMRCHRLKKEINLVLNSCDAKFVI